MPTSRISASNDVSVYTINAGTGALTAAGTVRARPGSGALAMTEGTTPVTYTPTFAYVANQTSGTVSVYTINADNGTLGSTNLGVITGSSPRSVTVDPAGRFAYVANFTSNSISAYTIDAATGALSPVTGSPFAALSGPSSVTVDPSGKFAYAANSSSNSVSAYTINAGSGALSQIDANQVTPGVQDFPAGTTPASVTVDPTGRFAYVANSGSTSVSAYSIDAITGALTAGAPVFTGNSPRSVTVDPTGKFAYVGNFNSNTVSAYTIDAGNGALTRIDADSGTVGVQDFPAETQPNSVTVDPSGKFAYVANSGSNTVSAYTINPSTGTLVAIGAAVLAGNSPRSVTVDPSGKFAYTANFSSNTVSAYGVTAGTGALTIINLNVIAVTGPVSIVTTGRIQ